MRKQEAIEKANRLAIKDDFQFDYFVVYDLDYETYVVANEWDIDSFFTEREVVYCSADY